MRPRPALAREIAAEVGLQVAGATLLLGACCYAGLQVWASAWAAVLAPLAGVAR